MSRPSLPVLAIAALLATVAVAPAADRVRPGHPADPVLEGDEPGAPDDDQVEPTLPDEAPPGRDDDLEPGPAPRLGPRSAPSLPEDEEPPPADVEPAHSGSGADQATQPAQPQHPLAE